jgi:hypothetical protein
MSEGRRNCDAIGVTGLVAFDIAPTPYGSCVPAFDCHALNAATLNRYVIPFVNPFTTCVVAVDANVLDGCGTRPT